MAQIYDRNNTTFMRNPVAYNYLRGNPNPIDDYSIWLSLDELKNYAKNNAVSYVGQVLTHVDINLSTVTTYQIEDNTGKLKKLEDNYAIAVLSSNIDKLWQDSKGGVNYQGHIKTYREHVTEDALSLSFLIAQYYDRHEIPGTEWLWSEDATTGKRSWLSSIPLHTGWMYCMTINEDYPIGSGKYTTKDGCEFTDRDYMIIHNHDNPELTSIQISAITRTDIDIIETQDDDYVRFELLNQISNILSADYVNKIAEAKFELNSKIDTLSLALSNEITSNVEALSTNLSNDIVSLSTNISNDIISLSTNISNDIVNLSTALSNDIIDLSTALSNEIDKISTIISIDLSTLSTLLSNDIIGLSIALSNEIVNLSTALSNDIIGLSTELSNDIIGLSIALSNDIVSLSTSLSNDIDTKYNDLTTQINTTSSYISAEVSKNDVDIFNIQNYISSDNSLCTELSNIKYHYNRTFTEQYYTEGGIDTAVDALNIVNSNNVQQKFVLIYLSGTLVLSSI